MQLRGVSVMSLQCIPVSYVSIALALLLPVAAQNYQFEMFTIPYPPNSPAELNKTGAMGINNRGAIVGYYEFGQRAPYSAPGHYAFKRHANGTLEYPIRHPDTGEPLWKATAYGINDYGTIAGWYNWHGFLIENGRFSEVSLDLATCPYRDTMVTGINNLGDFVGQAQCRGGFASIGGNISNFGDPVLGGGAVPMAIAWDTSIVGCIYVSGLGNVGLLRGPKGNFYRFQVAGSDQTCAYGINNAAAKIVGWHHKYPPETIEHSFVWDYLPDLTLAESARTIDNELHRITIQTIEVPGAIETRVRAINAHGVIVGEVITAEGVKAFVGTPIR